MLHHYNNYPFRDHMSSLRSDAVVYIELFTTKLQMLKKSYPAKKKEIITRVTYFVNSDLTVDSDEDTVPLRGWILYLLNEPDKRVRTTGRHLPSPDNPIPLIRQICVTVLLP